MGPYLQEGTVGLMEAVERYDPLAGVAFSLYAIHRIRGRMLNFLNANKKEILLKDGEEEKVFLAQAIPDMAFESADRESLHAAVDLAVQRLSAKEQDVIRSVYLAEQTRSGDCRCYGRQPGLRLPPRETRHSASTRDALEADPCEKVGDDVA